MTLIQHPDRSDISIPLKDKKFMGYYKISRHYGWALNTTFKAGFDYAIIVEGKRKLKCNRFDGQLNNDLFNNKQQIYYLIT